MKNILKYSIPAFALALSLGSCSDGYLDDITKVDAGDDAAAPTVEIISPTSTSELLPLNPASATTKDFVFQYKVTDDIELGSIKVSLDGSVLYSFDSFIDYRAFGDTFTYEDLGVGTHNFEVVAMDKAGKSTTKIFTFVLDKYAKINSSEVVYLPFTAGTTFMDYIDSVYFTKVGSPTNASGGYSGLAYKGASDSYISYPLDGLYSDDGISFTFWYKVNASPNKSGIITINDDSDNTNENRNQGLRLFREGDTNTQRIKLNVGTGAGDSWNDGGTVSVDGSWVHVAVTVSSTESKIYFNGVLQRTSTYSSFDFSTSTTLVLGSGAPSYTYWGHNSDLSLIDDFRVYNKALSATEVESTR